MHESPPLAVVPVSPLQAPSSSPAAALEEEPQREEQREEEEAPLRLPPPRQQAPHPQLPATWEERYDYVPQALWTAHDNAVFDVAWTERDARLVTASGDQRARLWDVETQALLASLRLSRSSSSGGATPALAAAACRLRIFFSASCQRWYFRRRTR